jgi:hypothetical protein
MEFLRKNKEKRQTYKQPSRLRAGVIPSLAAVAAVTDCAEGAVLGF